MAYVTWHDLIDIATLLIAAAALAYILASIAKCTLCILQAAKQP